MDTLRSDQLKVYFHEVKFALAEGEGPILREARDALANLALTQTETHDLASLDADVVDSIVQLDHIADYLLEDNQTQPLEKWWWHLNRIRRGDYPAELLPESLRGYYHPRSRAA